MHVQGVQKRELKSPLSPFAAASESANAAESRSPETARGQKGSAKPPLAVSAGLVLQPQTSRKESNQDILNSFWR